MAMIAVVVTTMASAATRNHELHTSKRDEAWPNDIDHLARQITEVIQ
jgi:hypothetical protein